MADPVLECADGREKPRDGLGGILAGLLYAWGMGIGLPKNVGGGCSGYLVTGTPSATWTFDGPDGRAIGVCAADASTCVCPGCTGDGIGVADAGGVGSGAIVDDNGAEASNSGIDAGTNGAGNTSNPGGSGSASGGISAAGVIGVQTSADTSVVTLPG